MPEASFGIATTPSVADDAAVELAHNPAHCDEGKGRLLEQYKGKPRMEGLICAFLEEVQAAEDVLWELYTERGLEVAEGVQLDQLGALVGEQRKGRSDADYRAFIRTRLLVLRSDGKAEQLIEIITTLIPTAAITLTEQQPASITIELADDTGTIDADEIFYLLVAAKAAGVRMHFVFPATTDDAFVWSYATPTADTDTGWGSAVTAATGGDLASVRAA